MDAKEGKVSEKVKPTSNVIRTIFIEIQLISQSTLSKITLDEPIEGNLIVKALIDQKKTAVLDGSNIMIIDISIIKCKRKVMGMK